MMVETYKKEGMNDKVYDLEQEKELMMSPGRALAI
jgi:hypothetical protein